MRELFAIGVEEHVIESQLLAGLALEQIDVDRVAFRDSILPATCFDDCVRHSLGKRAAKVPRRRDFDKWKSRLRRAQRMMRNARTCRAAAWPDGEQTQTA
jgi:hypothetical protein